MPPTAPPTVTAERFAQGMTFDEYLRFIASPENLAREGGPSARSDQSGVMRAAFEGSRLTADQEAALKWLVARPGGPARMLVISEEWSSDCRRDVPTFARIAEATSMELRIFTRDGQRYSEPPVLDDSPNGDLMAQFLNRKNGASYASIPVAAFFTRDMEHLYHYQEFPAIYDKDRLRANLDAPLAGDDAGWAELRAGPFFRVWTSAAVDEIISALHRKAIIGAV